MERRSESSDKRRAFILTALALLGPIFGVATQVWGQALMLLGLAVALIIAPPRRSPGAMWCVLALVILGLGLTAFLPVRWFPIPAWRNALTGEHRLELGGMLTPQPWVSVHAVGLLLAGLVFTLYVVTHPWSSHSRRQAARWYTGGILLLAVLALTSLATGWRAPFWPKVLNSVTSFGIFPNRNQTGNLFALAGIMAVALAFDGFEKGRKTALLWSAAVIVLGAAIVQTYSRAGILIFFGGIAVYGVLSFALSSSPKGGAITIAGFALLLTGFFIFGGDTFQRFQRSSTSTDTPPEYRVLIQKDALHLTGAAPWLGQGLGNFAPVFAMAREASAGQNRALHPESDWLWVAVEMGWVAAALLALACALWLRQCLPLAAGTDRALRSAALVCGAAFLIHSLADVSGHRPGTAWPALFLAGLALHPRRIIEKRRWPAPVFRMLGVLLALISAWWFASVFSERVGHVAPTMANAADWAQRAVQQNIESQHDAAVVSAGEALRIAPLNADMYHQRGVARLVEGFSVFGTMNDFATARFLEPRWSELCFAQGKAWTEAGKPDLAYEVWVEGLRRAGRKGADLYYEMLFWSRDHRAARALLGRLAQNDPEYFLVYLRQAERHECDLLIDQLMQAEPDLKSLSPPQRQALFSIWYRSGSHEALLARLLGNPAWRQESWRWLALIYAEKKQFQKACELVRDSIPVPAMPKTAAAKPIADLERLFRTRPDDIQVGLQLHSAQLAEDKTKDAFATLQALQALPNPPAYLAFIEAGQFEQIGDWEHAWQAWLRFGKTEIQ